MEQMKVLVEGSARHVHVTTEDLATLFGEGYELHFKRALSQPGQFLSEEKVTLEGPRGQIERVSILGPVRKASQVEVSFTDARALGVTPPVRESGDLAGSAPIKVIGPNGSIDLPEGCIVAKRHIHMTPEDAEKYGFADKETVCVRVEGERALTFDEVVIRVSPSFSLAMHIDFDEGNACCLGGETYGTVIKK